MTRRAAPLMDARGGGSVLTMTFNASQRAYPNYNIMAVAKAALEAEVRYLAMELGPRNIRVNAISAGPVRTLAARSITGFTVMEDHAERNAPLRRNIAAEDVGNAALYLCSPLASNVTGHILLVDAGYHVLRHAPADIAKRCRREIPRMLVIRLARLPHVPALIRRSLQVSSDARSADQPEASGLCLSSSRTSGKLCCKTSGNGSCGGGMSSMRLQLQGVDDGFGAVVVVVEGVRLLRLVGDLAHVLGEFFLFRGRVEVVVTILGFAVVPPLGVVAAVESEVAEVAGQRHVADRGLEARLVDHHPGDFFLLHQRAQGGRLV